MDASSTPSDTLSVKVVMHNTTSPLYFKIKTSMSLKVLRKAWCGISNREEHEVVFWFAGALVVDHSPLELDMHDDDLITVFIATSEENPMNAFKKCSSTLQSDLRQLLKNSSFSDVSLKIGDTVIRAHKAILSARCSKFNGMFTANMKEAHQAEIEIKYEHPQIFSLMLEFLYGDTIAISDEETALELLCLADEYLLWNLRELCEFEIIKYVTVSNAARLFEIAYKHNASVLKSYCKSFILTRYQRFLNCREFKEELKSPELLHELMEQLVPKEKINPSTPGSAKRKKQ